MTGILHQDWQSEECAVKRTVITMANRIEHHLLSGRLFHVDRRLERCGSTVYLDRSYVQHASIAGMRSILLPKQHLWVIFFEGHTTAHPIRCYMHMARILDEGETLTVEDLYLDVLVMENGDWHLVDIDEFRSAVSAGELSPEQIQAALEGLEHACRLVERYGPNIETHLHSLVAGKT